MKTLLRVNYFSNKTKTEEIAYVRLYNLIRCFLSLLYVEMSILMSSDDRELQRNSKISWSIPTRSFLEK